MKTVSPTSHSDVNVILDLLFTRVQKILQDQLTGMYLFGSLTNGDFDEYSDIDVLFVTDAVIAEDKFQALYEMHEMIAEIDSPWASQLEVSYIPKDALRHYDPENNKHPHIDRGMSEKLHIMQHDDDWVVQRYVLYECGITIAGPDPKSLIDPLTAGDLRRSVSEILHSWIHHFLDDHQMFEHRGYQSYTVLTVCRILYTYLQGDVVSKTVAADWAKRNLGNGWNTLIEDAFMGRQNPSQPASSDEINGTLDFIRFALDQIKPTPYPDVNEVLKLLHSSAKDILGGQFVGMYLYGSLSSGDFNPETSDIDFLFVTKDTLAEETNAALGDMHNKTWSASLKRAGKLEGAYVPTDLIRRHDQNGAACPTINEGKFYLAPLGSDWIIQRHVVREYGVIIDGPDPKTLIDFVTADDIRRAVKGTLTEWWFPMLDDPSWLRDKQSGDRAFGIITMCRVLHALEDGTITSKPKAIQWAKTQLGEPWNTLIDKAVKVSDHEELDVTVDEVLDFIRFVYGKAG
jgi:predicted nucleotidyltransferase